RGRARASLRRVRPGGGPGDEPSARSTRARLPGPRARPPPHRPTSRSRPALGLLPNEPRWRGGAVQVGAAWPDGSTHSPARRSRMRTGRRRNAWAALVGAIAVALALPLVPASAEETPSSSGTAEKTVFTVGIT